MTRPAVSQPAKDRLMPGLWVVLAVGTGALASIAGGTLASGGSSLAVLLGSSISRSGMAVAGVACIGLTLIGLLLPHHGAQARETAAVQRQADRVVLALSGAWLVLVLVGIVFRAADTFGQPVAMLTGAQLLRWTTALAAGRGMVLTAGCAAVVLGTTAARLRDPERVPVRVPLVAALLGVLTPAVTGHAGSAPDHQLAVVSIALHVGAAALWVGGLGAMLAMVARRRRLLDAALPRFSTLAGFCVGVVALTGLVNAQVRLPSWAALLTTGYGLLIVAKAVCLVLLACLGWLARRRLAAGRIPVLRWAGFEVALMAVTLGIAAALTQTA